MAQGISAEVYRVLTGEDDGRVCRDVPESACSEQPGNFLKHVASLAATKTGDGLADPKLVLSWLLDALGAPAWQIGLLVPVREAGSLLPQLVIAGWIRTRERRKWIWAAGSLVQGLAVGGMAFAAGTLDGPAAGAAVVGLLGLFALARAFCSVSYKDVLGKTVSKSTRGTATGSASTLASSAVLLFGVLVSAGILTKSPGMVSGALAVAGGLWLVAAAVFATLAEEPGATGGGGNPLEVAVDQLSLLRDDPQLVRFITTRGLLVATALAPPYILTLSGSAGGGGLGELGPFVIASSLAAVSSTYVWGRLSDGSSRTVLVASALVAAAALGAVAAVGAFTRELTAAPLVLPGLLFVLMVAYQGVRIGRSTHVVDMADRDTRAAYTALSNTIIGGVLLVSSVFGALAQGLGQPAVLATFAAMCLGAAWTGRSLEEVQREG
ncbi:MAG: MFS transporter [Gemmatimonadota bacterium]|jgi:hypothetical protein